MDRRALIAGLAAVVGAGACGSLARAEPLATVRQLGILRVAVYKDNRPWSWTDEQGVLRGIDVDLAKALATALSVKPDINEFMAGDDMAADLRNAVWRGGLLGFKRCDVMMHVPFDKQLQQENDNVAICAPYYRESFAAACGNEASNCELPPPEYKGRRLAAAVDTIPDMYLAGGFGGALRTSLIHRNTGYDAVAAIGAGTADFAVATRAEVQAALHDMANPQVHLRHGPLPAMMSPGWDVGMAVRENSRTLGDAIEQALAAMVADGRMAAIFGTYGVEWKPAING